MGRQSREKEPPPRKIEDQDYAVVTKILGSCNFEVTTIHGIKMLGRLAGSIRKRCWVKNHDVVLISYRDFQEKKCDIIYHYEFTDAKHLLREGVIPEWFLNPDSLKKDTEVPEDSDGDGDDAITFDEL